VNETSASYSDYGPAAPAPGSVSLRLPSTPPHVTYIILGLTIAVYLIQLATPNYYMGLDLPTFLGAKINAAIRAGQLWRLITPILLHGSILHIGFNMYALFIFGTGLERRFGHARFLILYLVAGFSGNVLSFLLSNGLSVGASTSIFGLIAAEGVFLYQNRKLFGKESKQAIGNVVSVAVINLVIGFSSGGLIDNWGHIGGLLGGLIFAWFGGPLWQVEGVFPLLHLVDKRAGRDVVLGLAAVMIIFNALAIVGIFWPIVP
jgi:rhomboid protease GluP